MLFQTLFDLIYHISDIRCCHQLLKCQSCNTFPKSLIQISRYRHWFALHLFPLFLTCLNNNNGLDDFLGLEWSLPCRLKVYKTEELMHLRKEMEDMLHQKWERLHITSTLFCLYGWNYTMKIENRVNVLYYIVVILLKGQPYRLHLQFVRFTIFSSKI